ncbi:hypothetical protein ACFS07_06325 [Undibacterium arcticum]
MKKTRNSFHAQIKFFLDCYEAYQSDAKSGESAMIEGHFIPIEKAKRKADAQEKKRLLMGSCIC